jgi:dTDP-D-glucose 4,6-dehydratase
MISFVKDRPGHDFRYAINTTKIKKDLNWEPKETFDSGLIKTIKWYLENENWWKKTQKNIYKQERLGVSP